MMGEIKIAIADDNKDFCDILEEYLSAQEDFKVVAKAYNGNQALEVIQEKEPSDHSNNSGPGVYHPEIH